MFYYTRSNTNTVDRYNLIDIEDFYYYNAGEIFEPELDIKNIFKKTKSKDVNFFLGEYNYFFEDSENIYILTDELGSIKWFFYKDENNFSVSNNFWYIAKKLNLGINNLNIQSFYESVLFYSPLNNKTYFNNLQVVPSGSLLIYSKKSKELTIEKIKKIEYKEEIISKYDWFKRIDNAFQKTIMKIQKNNSSISLAITISGGLDSRFPLFYTKTIKKKLAYLIGINNHFIDALDYKSAKKLANFFKIKLSLINPFKNTDFEKKMKIDVAQNPIGASNVLKSVDKKRSFTKDEEFNILLTGAYGGLIGGRILNDDLLNSSGEDLTHKMFTYYSSFSYLKELKSKSSLMVFLNKNIKKVLSQLGITNKQTRDVKEEIDLFLNDDFVIPSSYRNTVLNSFGDFFNKIHAKDSLSVIMNFHLQRHSIRGTFESLQGQVKAYSIYYPYVYELSKKWNIEYLKERRLMEEFLLWKDQETSHIPLQNFELPIHLKFKQINKLNTFFYKLKFLFLFSIRGLVINYNKWWYKADSQNFYSQLKKQNCKTFEKIFNKNDIEKIYKYKRHNLLLEHILKLKYILILIENNDYEKLINLDIFETDKY